MKEERRHLASWSSNQAVLESNLQPNLSMEMFRMVLKISSAKESQRNRKRAQDKRKLPKDREKEPKDREKEPKDKEKEPKIQKKS